jgi:uncharacterized protein (DUF2384 family)
MAANTNLDGTLQLPDGRTIPVVIKTDKAMNWLNSANHEFGGRTPREVAATSEGRDQILDVLTGLEHGFPA